MGKRGPCYHCGIQKTPLWRNGPPGKPVLCNACGSRWRTRGCLLDYIPKHAKSYMVLNSDASKKSHQDECFEVKCEYMPITGHNSIKPKVEESSVINVDLHSVGLEDDPINIKSSSGSAISSFDSCLQLEIKDKNEISGLIKTSVWGSYIPSRKRSLSKRRRGLSSVKILQRDLYYFLQDEKSSNLSRCPEEALIYFEKDQNAEIGLGSIPLKPPFTSTEQQSETCPLIMDNKVPYSNDAHKGSKILTNIPLTDLDALQIEYSPHLHATSEHSNVEGFKAIEENISSCSHHLGGKTSVTAKRTHDEICIQTSEGIDPDPIRALKKPKEEPEEISPGLRGVSFSLHEMPNMQLSMNVNKFEPPVLGNHQNEATKVDMTSQFFGEDSSSEPIHHPNQNTPSGASL